MPRGLANNMLFIIHTKLKGSIVESHSYNLLMMILLLFMTKSSFIGAFRTRFQSAFCFSNFFKKFMKWTGGVHKTLTFPNWSNRYRFFSSFSMTTCLPTFKSINSVSLCFFQTRRKNIFYKIFHDYTVTP